MVTAITAYIYRPSISKELKALYRHIIFFYKREREGQRGQREGGREKERGKKEEEEEERKEGRERERDRRKEGGRDVGREGEHEQEGQKDMMCYYTHFTNGTEWGSQ